LLERFFVPVFDELKSRVKEQYSEFKSIQAVDWSVMPMVKAVF
jgi:hypothetical protein